MSCGTGLGVHRSTFLLLAVGLCAAEECKESGGHCQGDLVEDASLLSIYKLKSHDVPQYPTISSSMRPPSLRPPTLHASRACSVGDHVKCPYHDVMCAGNQCCPRYNGTTFPCPSASGNFTGCESDTKLSDCLLPGPSPSTVAGAELESSSAYKYGKFEASIQYAGADGVISSFFLWKPESETSRVYWNELDYEKMRMCEMQLNLIDGMPGPEGHEQLVDLPSICTEFHTYAFEWTPDYIRWTVDDVEVRNMTGSEVDEFNKNVQSGMQFRFNVWPGDQSFGGNFNENDLPLYQYIDWARYSSYSGPGNFSQEWREDFSGSSMPDGWTAGNWNSPLGYSVHRPENIVFTGEYAVLALTPTSTVPTKDSIPLP